VDDAQRGALLLRAGAGQGNDLRLPQLRASLDGIETVGEARRGTFWYYFCVADRQQERVMQWAREIDDLMRAQGGTNRRSPSITSTPRVPPR
jgi:hypothetical protein